MNKTKRRLIVLALECVIREFSGSDKKDSHQIVDCALFLKEHIK